MVSDLPLETRILALLDGSKVTSERRDEYVRRAQEARDAFAGTMTEMIGRVLKEKAPLFPFSVDMGEVDTLVVSYYEANLKMKLAHGLSAQDRLETPQCAALWAFAIIANPCLTAVGPYDERDYYRVVGRQAFLFAFNILRQHDGASRARQLLSAIKPVREYMYDPCHLVQLSENGLVHFFKALCLMDSMLARCPANAIDDIVKACTVWRCHRYE